MSGLPPAGFFLRADRGLCFENGQLLVAVLFVDDHALCVVGHVLAGQYLFAAVDFLAVHRDCVALGRGQDELARLRKVGCGRLGQVSGRPVRPVP